MQNILSSDSPLLFPDLGEKRAAYDDIIGTLCNNKDDIEVIHLICSQDHAHHQLSLPTGWSSSSRSKTEAEIPCCSR